MLNKVKWYERRIRWALTPTIKLTFKNAAEITEEDILILNYADKMLCRYEKVAWYFWKLWKITGKRAYLFDTKYWKDQISCLMRRRPTCLPMW